jgi:hypothetical protein
MVRSTSLPVVSPGFLAPRVLVSDASSCFRRRRACSRRTVRTVRGRRVLGALGGSPEANSAHGCARLPDEHYGRGWDQVSTGFWRVRLHPGPATDSSLSGPCSRRHDSELRGRGIADEAGHECILAVALRNLAARRDTVRGVLSIAVGVVPVPLRAGIPLLPGPFTKFNLELASSQALESKVARSPPVAHTRGLGSPLVHGVGTSHT